MGEVPNTTQLIAGGIIFTGMLLSHEHPKEKPTVVGNPEQRLQAA
jgi:hypothetical protein